MILNYELAFGATEIVHEIYIGHFVFELKCSLLY